MARITEECVARIKDAADIVSVVGRYVQLRRAGYSWKACCPFHTEKTPSFHVNPARQSFHCFGCGVGGDAVKFLMMFENLDYPTALRRLADILGIPVIEEEENPEIARLRRLRSRVVELNELAAKYYHKMLCRSRAADHVRAYLKQRGVNIEVAKAWELGWAPPDFAELRQLAASRHIDARLLTEAYLLGKGPSGAYPVFRDRLMFPIRNVRGEVVGFSGRVMQADKDPRKYVNTAETVAFRKGELLFGLYKATSAIAKAGMSVVICEGQLDVIACHENADIRNAVAGLGTAFTEGHARILAKYAKKATLCYDGDIAGINASEKTYRKLAAAGLEVYQAELPAGEDPDSLIRTQGPEALREAISSARPYLEVRASQELARVKSDANARAALIPRMADLAAEISGSVRRDVAVVDLATRLNIGLDAFRVVVEQAVEEHKKSASRAPAPAAPYSQETFPEYAEEAEYAEDTPARVIPIRLHNTIRSLIIMAISHDEVQSMLVERIEDLQEPIRQLSGGVILQRVLEQLPTPGNSDAWAEFIRALPPEQAAALRNVGPEKMPEDDLGRFVDQVCCCAARDALTAKIDTLKSRILDPAKSSESKLLILQEIEQIQKILSGSPVNS